jgi:dienelactone hydrolase
MTLRFPEERPNERKDRHPAIVIAHTIGGYQEANEGWHAEAFRKQGFATVTYPSMAVRRLVDGGAATAAWPSAVAEAYAAFRLLAEHPNIDADRIAILGFSFGGEVAYLTAFERLRAALLPGAARFAGACRLLSGGGLWRRRRARRLYGRADPDVAG